jgi:hypothetical protein
MATNELILDLVDLDPQPVRQVVRIDRTNYDMVHDSILANLRVYGPMTSMQLGAMVEDQLQDDFVGPLMWYYSMVSSDMLACGEMRAVPGSRPQLFDIL